jgi:carboxyl-terminal processing protease
LNKIIILLGFGVFVLMGTDQANLFAFEEEVIQAGEVEETAKIEDMYSDLEIFANALTVIESHYVEKTPPKDLIYGSLKGMLSSLDPYSQFLNPEAYSEIRVETEGKFGGIGVEITIKDGVLTVITPVDGTPAAEAGVAPGDKIVKIDDKSTRYLSLEDSVKLLRGEAGSNVKLTILRESESRILDVEINRSIINVKSIKKAEMMRDNIGYVRISEFQENTAQDLRESLMDLEDKGMKGLILDLRNNPGGLLPSAVEVAEIFVPKGELVVGTKGRNEAQNMRFVSNGQSQRKPYRVVVLVNHGSASGSEIVAGALRDHGLAILLGTTTFGKGSIQTVIPMRDGSALRLTTGKYYTPLGDMIHGKGISPDIDVPYERIKMEEKKEDAKKQKVREIFKKVEQMTQTKEGPSEAEEEASNEQYDNQIMRAIDLLLALDVYGDNKIDVGQTAL